MAHSVAFVACLALLSALVQCSPVDHDSKVKVNFDVVESLEEYLKENLDVETLQPLDKEVQTVNGVSLLTHKFGERVEGDHLEATAQNSRQFPVEVSVKATSTYPPYGEGVELTYVQIDTEQSSDRGDAYITAGGIGQRKISIVIVSEETNYIKLNAKLYGK